MILKELVKDIDVIKFSGDLELDINAVQYDSRMISRGDLFVCVRGFKTDGHKYIKSAIEKGAVALVVEDLTEAEVLELDSRNIYWIKVACAREALACIASRYYNNPSDAFLLTGVTGTNGKTSVSQILTDMMKAFDKKCAVLGTIQNKIGDEVFETAVTTPESLELNMMYKMMVERHVECCTMEVSSHAVELKRVHGIGFDYGIFTNLTKDHLDFHVTMEAYYKAKAAFFNLTQKGNVINTDDEYGQRLMNEVSKLETPCLSYGIDKAADLMARNIGYAATHSTFELVTPTFSGMIQMPIPGKIYVYNALSAIGIMYLEGYSLEAIQRAVKMVQPVRGRLEVIKDTQGVNVIVDYSHTPDALKNALKVVRRFTDNRVITVFGCGGNRDKTKRPEMGKVAAMASDYAIVTSDNPRHEEPNSIIADVVKGIDVSPERFTTVVDRRQAIYEALDFAETGDTILIAGKGHETYQILGDIKVDFDDAKVVRDYFLEDRNGNA